MPGLWDARFDTPLTQQGIINGTAVNALGIASARIVAPGDLSRSILFQRASRVGQQQMPPLARNVVAKNRGLRSLGMNVSRTRSARASPLRSAMRTLSQPFDCRRLPIVQMDWVLAANDALSVETEGAVVFLRAKNVVSLIRPTRVANPGRGRARRARAAPRSS